MAPPRLVEDRETVSVQVARRRPRMPKLLTPVDLGALALSHRVVVLACPGRARWTAPSYTRQASSGGLVIHALVPDQDPEGPAVHQHPPGKATWSRVNDVVHAKGGTSVAQISYDAVAAASNKKTADATLQAYRSAATLLRAAGFDGIELDATRHVAPLPATPLLETVQALIDIWGADRVGVQLAPFAWITGRNDKRTVNFHDELLSALAGMEIAWLHLSGTATPERGDLSTSALGQGLRKAYHGMVIASGLYTPASAIAAVESRWADAIGFTLVSGYGDDLIRTITAAGTPSRAESR